MTTAVPTSSIATNDHAEALAFEAPYLVEKLLKDHVVSSSKEAEALFREVKRYLVLTASSPTIAWGMYSLRIDQIWHQFILFTRQYIEYCRANFGKYIQHAPSTAPAVDGLPKMAPSTLDMFAERYEELFGEPLPDLWYDEKNVTLDRRIVNSRSHAFHLQDDDDMVELLSNEGEAVFAVDQTARSALEFIAHNGSFFVRELPGEISDEQRIALVSTLIEYKLLNLAS
ncbi:glycine-rich domain-containing protein [Pararhizobium sp. DWP3-4]|uniref:glycine-rich domain-containing protein n=1 Tax=Pararhizobium sp. DWP3-4 TaxID=2804565 RepID=UPI003CF98BD2